MPYTSAPFSDFPGLDLRSSPDNSGCIDCLNVEFDRYGAVRSRDGYDNFTSSAAANRYTTVFGGPSSTLLAGKDNTDVDALNVGGGVDATTTLTGGSTQASYVNFGTPSASYTYIQATGATTRRWSGSAFAAPTATVDGVAGRTMPSTRFVGLMPTDNRLIAAGGGATGGPNGVASSASHVWFSDAGNAESWTTSNYIILTPGDGEVIQAVVTWNTLVFVFKESRAFVFYGNSVDSTGQPVFNYRPLTLPATLTNVSVTVGTDGVYFNTGAGVYRTTGGPSELISSAITPIWRGGANSFYQGPVRQASTTYAPMTWFQDRLYVGLVATGLSYYTLVWDSRTGTWTLWDVPASWFASAVVDGSNEKLFFTYGTGSKHVGVLGSSYTTDDGAAITSRWRSGFYDLGIPDAEKDIARTRLWGTGSVSYTMSRDFGSLGTAQTQTLGTSPAISSSLATNNPKPGFLFSHKLSAGAYDYENLITNPSFEVDTTGWTNTGLVSMARDTSRFKYGSASLKCVSDAAADRTRWATGTLTSGQQYTFAVWVYLESTTTDYLFVQATDNSGAGPGVFTDSATGQISTTGSWQRLYVTFTATSSTIHYLSVRQNGAGGATWYVDGALYVAGPVMDYFDGSLAGAYWTGTANASTSRHYSEAIGSWTVHRLAHEIRGQRPPSAHTG